MGKTPNFTTCSEYNAAIISGEYKPEPPNYSPTDNTRSHSEPLEDGTVCAANWYWTWSGGEWYLRQCPSGLVWNQDLETCDFCIMAGRSAEECAQLNE